MLIDVRSKEEFDSGHIKGSINIPIDEIRKRLNEIDVKKNHPIYVSCQSGTRAYIALRILQGNGYSNVSNLSGGYETYSIATKKFGDLKE